MSIMKHSWILALFLAQASSSLLGMMLRKDGQVWGAGNGEKHALYRRFDEFESSGGFESDYFEGFGSGFNDVPQHDYGQFNSDTSGCRSIETKACSEQPDCAGCLGLYSCNLAVGKCQLKGLSRKSGGFHQSLKDV